MRHDGRADDPDREIDRSGAVEVRDEPVRGAARRRADLQRLVEEAEQDQPEQRGDRELEAPEAVPLQLEQRERDHAGDEAGRQERHVEEEVEAERRADELRDVGRHRHRLGLDPEPPGDRARVVVAAQLRQVAVGDDAELRREVLDQHRHEVRERATTQSRR